MVFRLTNGRAAQKRFTLRAPAVTMARMSSDYDQLLDATIQHLREMKSHGARFVTVSPDALAALDQPRPPVTTAQKPPQPAVEMPLPLALPGEAAVVQSAIPNPQSAIEKAAAFAELRELALACVKCPHLASSRK